MARERSGYSPALDGVRGVFMLCFMAFHLGVSQLEGMWIAINLFFILSAFLIVRILAGEHARYGDIDVIGFYQRRARRLLPALLLLLLTVSLWWGTTSEGEVRRRLGGDVLATLGYVMNWRLLLQGDQYFGDQGGASPLRHAWTLSIEEQFYLLVPFVIMALLLVFRRRRGLAVAVLLAGAAASAAWTAVLGFQDASDYPRLYYGTDTRAQALFLGAALGLWMAPDRRGRTPAPLPRALVLGLGAVGLATTLFSFVLIDAYTPWMFNAGGILAFGLGSVALVIGCVDERPSLLKSVFGWRPLVHTGRLSYGLYLWHWPVALVLVDLFDGTGVGTVVVGSLVTYAIAHLSWTYLERPVIRRGVRGLLPTRQPVLLGGTAIAAVAAAGLVLSGTAPAPAAPTAQAETAGPVQPLVEDQQEYVPDEPGRIGVYGDSVPFFLTERFPAESFPGVTLDNYGEEGCDLLAEPMSWAPGFSMGNTEECAQLKETWPETFEERGDEVLLIFASPLLAVPHVVDGDRLWLDDPRYLDLITERLDTVREEAKGAGAEQVQIVNVPCRKPVPESIPEEFRVVFESSEHIVEEYKDPELINGLVSEWAATHDDVEVVDLNEVLCADGYPEEVNGLPIYNDFLHFSPEATPMLWTWILGQVSQNYQGVASEDASP